MDPLLKELTKLEKLTATSSKGPSIAQSLDSLLHLLHQAREKFVRGECSEGQCQTASTDGREQEKGCWRASEGSLFCVISVGQGFGQGMSFFPYHNPLANWISRNLLPHFQLILNYSLFRPPWRHWSVPLLYTCSEQVSLRSRKPF